MHDMSCCNRQFDGGPVVCASESLAQSSNDVVAPASGNSSGQSPTLHELNRLREELERTRKQLTAVEVQRLSMKKTIDDLSKLISTDELTGLRNRNRFKEELTSASHSQRVKTWFFP